MRLFVLAADLLNISAAGRQLGLAPAVASARLSKLENQLGADLLHRSTREVSLSLEGAEFLVHLLVLLLLLIIQIPGFEEMGHAFRFGATYAVLGMRDAALESLESLEALLRVEGAEQHRLVDIVSELPHHINGLLHHVGFTHGGIADGQKFGGELIQPFGFNDIPFGRQGFQDAEDAVFGITQFISNGCNAAALRLFG